MAMLPDTAKDLVRMGANLVIDDAQFIPDILKELALLAKASGATITIRAANLIPATMKDLARIGGKHVTFRV